MADTTVTLDIVGRDRASRAFSSVGKSADRTANRLEHAKRGMAALGKVAALGMAAGVGIAAMAMKSSVDAASDLAESTSKVGVVFGKQAKAIVKASDTSAKAMGLSKEAYLEATGTLGNLLVSLDLAPKKVAGMSTKMVALAGDMASFNNVDPAVALDALRSGLTGETEPLKQFGVNMNDATLKAQALKMGLIKSTKEALTPQTKALAATRLIMKQTGTAQGDFARTSGGLANQQRILSAQWDDMKGKIGAVLLPAVTSIVTAINTKVIPAVKDFGTKAWGFIQDKVVPAFNKVRDEVVPALQALVGYIRDTTIPALKNLADKISPALSDTIDSLVDSVKIMSGVFGTSGSDTVKFAGKFDKVNAAALVIQGALFAVRTNVKLLAGVFRVSAAAPILYAHLAAKAILGMLPTILDVFGGIVHGAARAFGWMPGIGPKLKKASAAFDSFRADVEAALSGGFKAGENFTAGLAAGIRSGGAVAEATALGVARKVTAAVNSAKGFGNNSPSKKGIQSGRWFVEGIALGMRDATVKGLQAAQDLVDRISARMETRLGNAVDRLSALKDKARTAFDTASGGVGGFLDIGQIGAPVTTTDAAGNETTSTPSAAGLFAGFAANAKAFAAALAAMAAKKLPLPLITAVAGSGNLAAATALADLNPTDTASIISSTAAIASAQKQAGGLLQGLTVDPKLIAAATATVAEDRKMVALLDKIDKKLGNLDKDTTVSAKVSGDDLLVLVTRAQKKADRR
jgi:hypothetical protein